MDNLGFITIVRLAKSTHHNRVPSKDTLIIDQWNPITN